MCSPNTTDLNPENELLKAVSMPQRRPGRGKAMTLGYTNVGDVDIPEWHEYKCVTAKFVPDLEC